MLKALIGMLCFIAVFGAGMFLVQHSLLYPKPRPYDTGALESLDGQAVVLEYRTAQGRQRAFYVPPKGMTGQGSISIPDNVWFLFTGIGGLALSWWSFVERFPGRGTGFVLIDYPGFGASEGKATPESTQESAEAAFAELGRLLKVPHEILEQRLNILGTSFGTGAAAQFAASQSIKKVVLVSPYSSLFDAACYRWKKPLCYLLRYHYDTDLRLTELALRKTAPHIYIFHGECDRTLPVDMARKLARISPKHINYREFPNEGHEVLFSREDDIYAAMVE